MKKVYSISLNEQLVEALDRFCLRAGITRSEAISKLLVDHVNGGVNPDEIDANDVNKRKIELILGL